ncbi:MAG: hypothetical protein ACFFA3_18125 [Promethearchaeota archaeon]
MYFREQERQLLRNIDGELKNPHPSKERIINCLYDLRTKENFQDLSDSKFYNIFFLLGTICIITVILSKKFKSLKV